MSSAAFRAPTIEELQPHFVQYALEGFVAEGGMGAVYRARQLSVDRPVALKILPPDLATDERFRERFAMEARAMARLSHRNLVQIYDFGETNGIVWMIQEWVEGRNVLDVLREDGQLDPAEAAALVAQACEGLGYAHKQGIVHRDVKPGNMMLDGEGILKLMDFGLARAVSGDPAELCTGSGARFATEEYAAPELWDLEREVDHRVDIFALGVLLYEALTAARPTGTFRMPSEVRKGLDRRYDQIVVRAMQRQPENRYPDCTELMNDLRKVVRTSKAPASKLRTPAARPTTRTLKPVTPAVTGPAVGAVLPVQRNRSVGMLVIGILAVLAVVITTIVVISRLNDDEQPGGPETSGAPVGNE